MNSAPTKRPETINAYLRRELESLMPRAAEGHGPFTVEQIEAELARRDDIHRKAQDRLNYPHLSHS